MFHRGVSDGDFLSNVVVTSSSTVADIDAIVAAQGRIQAHAVVCRDVLEVLNNAMESAAANSAASGASLGHVVACLSHAQQLVMSVEEQVGDFTDSLGYSAVVYAGAEDDAAHFSYVAAQVGQRSTLPWVNDVVSRSVSPFFAPVLSIFGRGEARQEAAYLPPVWSPARLQMMSVMGSALPFMKPELSTAADSFRMQYDVENLSTTIMAYSHGPSGASGTATAGAAALAASSTLGWGRLIHGETMGIEVASPGVQPGSVVSRRVESSGGNRGLVWSNIPGAQVLSSVLMVGSMLGVRHQPTVGGSGSVPVFAPPPGMNIDTYKREHAALLGHPSLGVQPASTPRAPSELIDRLGNLADGQQQGQFEILRHDTQGPRGRERSWSIVIRGTQQWTTGHPNPQDMLTNFQTVAGQESDQTRAIREGMRMAGIQVGDRVEFVGHSQGGAIAAQLATDPQISEDYSVVSVLTAGSPTAGYSPHAEAGMLSLENTRDIVPALDGAANPDEGNALTMYFDGADLGLTDEKGNPRFSHDMTVYSEAMRRSEAALAGNNPQATVLDEVDRWMRRREQGMGLSESTITTSYVFNTERMNRPLWQ